MLPLLNSSYLPQTWTLTTQNRKQFIKNKDRLILKPSNLFEGKGIVIGKQTSLEERE
jgi:uncharacterized circularly permuted ATP-grasp superfamily protein